MLTIQQLNNLRVAAGQANKCEKATGVPCELTLAQWVLESGWGQHAPGNNCFGIKEYPNCFGTQLLFTTEFFTEEEKENWLTRRVGRTAAVENATPNSVGRMRYKAQDWFASFQTLADCFTKRATLFTKLPYKPFMDQYLQDRNLVSLIQGIAPHYATDPDYAKQILSISSIREVQDAIKESRGCN